MDAKQLVNRFERYTGQGEFSVSFGGATLNLGGGERTLGYRYTESILPVDGPVYVLGVIQDDGSIGAPQDGGSEQRFLISYRTEEELEKNLVRNARWLGLGALGALLLGIALAVVGAAILFITLAS